MGVIGRCQPRHFRFTARLLQGRRVTGKYIDLARGCFRFRCGLLQTRVRKYYVSCHPTADAWRTLPVSMWECRPRPLTCSTTPEFTRAYRMVASTLNKQSGPGIRMEMWRLSRWVASGVASGCCACSAWAPQCCIPIPQAARGLPAAAGRKDGPIFVQRLTLQDSLELILLTSGKHAVLVALSPARPWPSTRRMSEIRKQRTAAARNADGPRTAIF
jgi:hypothetical protein